MTAYSRKQTTVNPAKIAKNKGNRIQLAIADFKDYITKCTKVVRTETMDEYRKYELYPSSFPYCGLRHGLDAFTNKKLKDEREMDFFGAYYTTVGGTVHEVVQDWLSKGNKIIGNFRCTKCNNLDELEEYGPCSKCGCENVKYEEIVIKYKGIIRGRIDGLYIDSSKRVYVIDYKTSGGYGLYLHNSGKELKFPYLTNKLQIQSYCYFVKRMYEKKLLAKGYKGIEGWMLIYMSRDKSFREYAVVGDSFTDMDYDEQSMIQHRSVKHFTLVVDAADAGFKEFPQELVDEKPCSCKEDYLNNMHDQYNECPFSKICFSPKKLDSFIAKL